MEQKKNQWHPGFAAAIRMELKDDRERLLFEEEHLLSKKPLQIDMLITQNRNRIKIKNKIGQMFRKYNIVEYKSPDDTMSVDTFYKVIGYACLYKAGSEHEDEYHADDITITLIRQRYPAALMKYLKNRGCSIEHFSPGIYYVYGNILFPIQILVTQELDRRENIWLHSLQNDISRETYTELMTSVERLEHKDRELYGEAVLQVVINANDRKIGKWKEENQMTCEALQRIMAPELEASRRKGELEGRRKGELEGRRKGELEGRRIGELEGKRIGELAGELRGKILAYTDVGMSIETIAEKLSLSLKEVEEILANC